MLAAHAARCAAHPLHYLTVPYPTADPVVRLGRLRYYNAATHNCALGALPFPVSRLYSLRDLNRSVRSTTFTANDS